MISVITSTYNRVERLKKCIKSVQDQTYTDYEHIIVDDHSTDGTQAVVANYRDDKIVYVRRTRNSGCDTKPKNEGIKVAKGKYIAFLDDDNTYRPDHLQALVNVLEANPSIAMVYADRWITDQTGTLQPQIGVFHDFDPYLLLERNYIDTSDVLIRKEVLEYVGGFDERYKKYVDWNLWVRLVKAGFTFARVPLILTNYTIHTEAKSQKDLDQKAFSVPAWDSKDCDIFVSHVREVTPPKIAIFTITYNRYEYNKVCIESLHNTAGFNFDHFIVDNGSFDGTKGYLHKLHQDKKIKYLVSNDQNTGISHASNQALEVIGNDYDIIVKVDPDCYFKSNNWLDRMVWVWMGNHKIALSCYIEGLKDNPGGATRTHYGKIRGELLGMTRHLGGICCFVDSKAYQGFRWNDNDFLHGAQDVEFSQHLLKQGYEMAYLENYYASHGIAGTEQQHKDYPEYFEKRKNEKTTRYQS